VEADWPDRPADSRISDFPKNDRVDGAVTQRISTSAGTLEVRNGCSQSETFGSTCQSLVLGNIHLHEDFGVKLTAAYPVAGTPEFVIARSNSGGNCCAPEVLFLDLSSKKVLSFDGIQLRGAITITAVSNGILRITGLNASDTDDYGDPIVSNYLYYRDRRFLTAAPYDRHTNFSTFIGQYSNDLLSDVNFRSLIAQAFGADFKAFREHIETESPVEFVDHRFLVGEGIVPHDGPNGGIYIFDIATGKTCAFWFDDANGMKHVGNIPTGEQARAKLTEWLAEFGQKLP
jgi:hypothetical protein